jgi:hypothetical protein
MMKSKEKKRRKLAIRKMQKLRRSYRKNHKNREENGMQISTNQP